VLDVLTDDPIQTFSPDSRWLVTTSLDSIIRTYDVPTGQLVDAFRTTSISTSLTFSPTGDFLATAQVDSVGVFLWANKAQFSEVALRHIDEDDITNVSMPSVHGTDDDAGKSSLCQALRNEANTADVFYRLGRHHCCW
jgi:U3 small nucleolar RNA-associated protein 21